MKILREEVFEARREACKRIADVDGWYADLGANVFWFWGSRATRESFAAAVKAVSAAFGPPDEVTAAGDGRLDLEAKWSKVPEIGNVIVCAVGATGCRLLEEPETVELPPQPAREAQVVTRVKRTLHPECVAALRELED